MTTGRPNILVLTTNLSASGGTAAGAAGNTWRLILEAVGEHADGLVIAPRADGAPARETLGGLRVRRLRPARPVSSLEDALRGPGAVRVAAVAAAMRWEAGRALRSEHFDLVHALWAFPAGWAATGTRHGLPVLLSCPGSDLHAWAHRRGAGAVVRRTVRRSDLVAATSNEGVREAHRLGAPIARAVPICFDPDVFGFVPELPSEPVIAYTGRLTRSKGIFVLAEALERLAPKVPGLALEVCGTGPDAAPFEQAARRTLGDRARFHGPLPPVGVAEILARSRVAVLPSFGEGMAAAAVEALAVGRPMVSTDVGEHPALLRRGGGLVVPSGDPQALAEALAAELAVPREPARLRALAAPYSPACVAAHILDLYALVTRRPAPLTPRPGGPTPTGGGTHLVSQTYGGTR